MTDHLPQPAVEDLDLAAVLAALADPVRLAAVRAIATAGELACGQVPLESGITKSTLSHHLKILREAGITQTRIDGARRPVSLRRADLEARFPGLLDVILSASPAGVRA